MTWSCRRPACPSLVPLLSRADHAVVHPGTGQDRLQSWCRNGQAAAHAVGSGSPRGFCLQSCWAASVTQSQLQNHRVTLPAWCGSVPDGCGVGFCCTRSWCCCSDLLSYSGLIKFKKQNKPRQNPQAPRQQNHKQRNKWLLLNLFFNVLKLLWKINKTQIL